MFLAARMLTCAKEFGLYISPTEVCYVSLAIIATFLGFAT